MGVPERRPPWASQNVPKTVRLPGRRLPTIAALMLPPVFFGAAVFVSLEGCLHLIGRWTCDGE